MHDKTKVRAQAALDQMKAKADEAFEARGMRHIASNGWDTVWMLKDGLPYKTDVWDVEFIAWWQQHDKRQLARWTQGDTTVSTVFLTRNYAMFPEDPPILWETLVYTVDGEKRIQRYTSQEAALLGHNELVQWVLNGMPQEGSL